MKSSAFEYQRAGPSEIHAESPKYRPAASGAQHEEINEASMQVDLKANQIDREVGYDYGFQMRSLVLEESYKLAMPMG